MEHTPEQIADWRAYEHVRSGGKYNMLTDRRARRATGLSQPRYHYCMAHYDSLRRAAEASETEQPDCVGFVVAAYMGDMTEPVVRLPYYSTDAAKMYDWFVKEGYDVKLYERKAITREALNAKK